MATQLTEHFTLEELLQSETAVRNNFTEQFNPPQAIKDNLLNVAIYLLEPLRAAISKKRGEDTPVIITSAYRCERVNGSVPGSANHSQHELGCAVDTHVECMTVDEWATFIRDESGIDYDQLIQEHNLWAHISFDKAKPQQRHQSLQATGSIANPIYSPY